jgi:hypothetical protein
VWLALGALTLVLLAAAFFWPAQVDAPQMDELQLNESQPMADVPIETPIVTAVPVVPVPEPSPAVEAVTTPAPEAVAETQKPVEKKQPKRKPTVVKKTEPVLPQEAVSGSAKSGAADNSRNSTPAIKPEPVTTPAEPPQEQSGWDAFKQSVKQGTKAECSQAERALNQCK